MKKMLAVLVALVALTACGGDPTTPVASEPSPYELAAQACPEADVEVSESSLTYFQKYDAKEKDYWTSDLTCVLEAVTDESSALKVSMAVSKLELDSMLDNFSTLTGGDFVDSDVKQLRVDGATYEIQVIDEITNVTITGL